MPPSGGNDAVSGLNLASLLRFCSVLQAGIHRVRRMGPRSLNRAIRRDALEVRKEHLDLLSATPRLHVFRYRSDHSGGIMGIFVEIARHLTRRSWRVS